MSRRCLQQNDRQALISLIDKLENDELNSTKIGMPLCIHRLLNSPLFLSLFSVDSFNRDALVLVSYTSHTSWLNKKSQQRFDCLQMFFCRCYFIYFLFWSNSIRNKNKMRVFHFRKRQKKTSIDNNVVRFRWRWSSIEFLRLIVIALINIEQN